MKTEHRGSNFQSDILLENAHALLRPLSMDDFGLLLPFSLEEPELCTDSLVSAAGPENLKKYLDYAFAEKTAGRSYPFLVIDKKKGKVAGSTRFYDYQPVHNTVQLGFTWYGKEFQRTGLNRNCKYLLLEYAFDVLRLDRVEFRADNNNKRSIAAMKSIGCVEEGVLRSNCAGPTGRRDSIVLSILRNEWEEKVRGELGARIG